VDWYRETRSECADLPNFVKAAREASRVVPGSVLKMVHLPGPDVMADFVAWDVGRQFHPVSDITSRFHTVQFALLPSISFLCLVNSKPKFKTPQIDPVDLLPVDIERFRSLNNGVDKLQSAMKLFKKRTTTGNLGAREE